MVVELTGDVFNYHADVICHQVNCKGAMGAGIAKIIKTKISPQSFSQYQQYCWQYKAGNLGNVFYTPTVNHTEPTIIANCFAQDDCVAGTLQTNYGALRRCMEGVKKYAIEHNLSIISVPGYIGCGLAGGDWDLVKNEILYPCFEKEPNLTLQIVYLKP